MITRLPAGSAAALDPVRAALLAGANADAEAVRSDAHRRAGKILDAAGQEAARILAAARSDGQAQARTVADTEAVRARREARAVLLAAQRALYDELRRRCRAAVAALRDEPGYPALLRRLTERSQVELGPHATVRESAAGGIVAQEGSRLLDLSLPTLADQALDQLDGEVRQLWAP